MGFKSCRVYSPRMTAANRHRSGAKCSETVSNDELEEVDGDFTTICDDSKMVPPSPES